MSELSELLQKHLPKGWSGRRLGREARERGYDLSDASATAYLGGRHGVPDDSTIEAFVHTLRVSESAVRKAAGVRLAGEPWQPHEDSRYLRDDQRIALDHLISTMVERKAGTGDAAPAAQKNLKAVPDLPASELVAGPEPGQADAAQHESGPSEGQQRRDQQDKDALDDK